MSLEGQQIDRYRILRLLGSGGMGDVYLAEDARIEQRVAIKVIRAEVSPYPNSEAGQEAARLFQREARAIVKLDHPHILPLFDYGEERLGNMTIIYLVMPYRQEGSLADWLRLRSQVTLLPLREVASIVSQAASALQHAHDRQIIHQDVKPSNFLLRHRPETPTLPDLLLADFGIARFSTATSGASLSIRGTPTSMAPEQWQGHAVPATDQYALAVMIYELLCGRPPFQGAPGPLMYQHLTDPPPPPSSINPRLTSELDAVLLHALAKQPEQRFASVAAFANALLQVMQAMPDVEAAMRMATTPVPASQGDIRAVLAISAAEAHAGTTRTLTLPGGRKVKVPVPAGVRDGQVVRMEELGKSSPEDGAVGALILLIRVEEERPSFSTASAIIAEDTVRMADQAAPATGMSGVSNTGQPPTLSKTVLPKEVTTPPASPPESTKPAVPITPWFGQPTEVDQADQAEWRGGAIPVIQPWQPPAAVRVRPLRPGISRRSVVVGLAALAVGSVAGGLFWLTRSRQPAIGAMLYTYRGHSGYVWTATWSPDGKRIASGSDDHTVQVWDAADGGNVYIYHGHSKAVTALAWSPDGKRIASGSDDHTVQVWDAAGGGNLYIYHGHSHSVTAVAWSPDSSRIVSGSADKTVQVWDAAGGGNVYAYPKYSAWLRAVAWSPDGQRIASGSDDYIVQVWDVASGSPVYTYRGHSRSVTAVAWSLDSQRIASGSADKTVQVWDAASGSNAYIYRGHSDSVEAVTWSPDGKRIASGSLDQSVQVWDAAGGGNVYTYSRHASGVYVVVWSPDGSRIASAGTDETVQVWEAE